MHAPQPSTALWTRSGALWRVLDRPLFETRVRELANALLELDRPPESVFALEHAATSEALTFAVAALEAGLTVRLGLAQPPLAAAGAPRLRACLDSSSVTVSSAFFSSGSFFCSRTRCCSSRDCDARARQPRPRRSAHRAATHLAHPVTRVRVLQRLDRRVHLLALHVGIHIVDELRGAAQRVSARQATVHAAAECNAPARPAARPKTAQLQPWQRLVSQLRAR